ncbi:MAG: sugar phosphate isomerase/epimerase, partial [Clostridia bacterium]|nr:sugar phosphate isomerase/epimerase [Clostridia bacterium]
VDRNVGVVADFGNIYHVEEEIDDFIRFAKDRICHVHIKDILLSDKQLGGGLHTVKRNFMHERPLGDGCVKFNEGMKLLKEYGYNGYYSLEYGAPDDDSPFIDKALKMIAEAI